MTKQQYIILAALGAFQFSWLSGAIWAINNGGFLPYLLTLPLWGYVSIRAAWLVGGDA